MAVVFIDRLLKEIPHSIWKKIVEIDGLRGQWIGGAKLNPQVLGRLKQSVLVTSTGASTRIEGGKLSDEQVEKLMRGISIQRFTDRDAQEVQGYFELLTNVFNSWNVLRFSENLIKHFHQELLKYVEKDTLHRGEYKKQDNKVLMVDNAGQSMGILFDTTPAYLTSVEMMDLVEETQQLLKSKYHPLLVIGVFIVAFLQIHPFQDGNGRLSRILTNLLLLQAGYGFVPYVSHEKIIEDNKPDYYMALRKSQKTFSTKYPTIIAWMDFFLDVVLTQSHQAIDLLSASNTEKLLSQKQLTVWQYVQQVDDVSPKELAEQLHIPRPTINQIANRLIGFKKIERVGQGRAVRYRATIHKESSKLK